MIGLPFGSAYFLPTSAEHPERVQVSFENCLGFLALVDVLAPELDDGAQRLHVEAVALGFREHIADVVGEGLLLLLKSLDALDERLELILGEPMRGRLVFGLVALGDFLSLIVFRFFEPFENSAN